MGKVMWLDNSKRTCTPQLFFLAIALVGLVCSATVVTSGDEVTREQAIDIAQQELRRATSDPKRYEVYVDEENKLWQQQMWLYKESEAELYRKYNSVLKRQKYWTIFLTGRTPEGHYPKDDQFTAIIHKHTGKILFFIPGG